MLHTKFPGNRHARPGEEDFCRGFTIYGCGGHLGNVNQMSRTNFRLPYPRRFHIKFSFDWASRFREKMFKLWMMPYARPWVYYIYIYIWAKI